MPTLGTERQIVQRVPLVSGRAADTSQVDPHVKLENVQRNVTRWVIWAHGIPISIKVSSVAKPSHVGTLRIRKLAPGRGYKYRRNLAMRRVLLYPDRIRQAPHRTSRPLATDRRHDALQGIEPPHTSLHRLYPKAGEFIYDQPIPDAKCPWRDSNPQPFP